MTDEQDDHPAELSDDDFFDCLELMDITPAERYFFDEMFRRFYEEEGCDNCDDFVMPGSNPEAVYIWRMYDHSFYYIHCGITGECYFLYDMLDHGLVTEDWRETTIWQWLAAMDFSCVSFNDEFLKR